MRRQTFMATAALLVSAALGGVVSQVEEATDGAALGRAESAVAVSLPPNAPQAEAKPVVPQKKTVSRTQTSGKAPIIIKKKARAAP